MRSYIHHSHETMRSLMDLNDRNTLVDIIITSAESANAALHPGICTFILKIIEYMITNSHLPDQYQFLNRFADRHLHCKIILTNQQMVENKNAMKQDQNFDKSFKPVGTVAFIIVLLVFTALVWFSIYNLQITRH